MTTRSLQALPNVTSGAQALLVGNRGSRIVSVFGHLFNYLTERKWQSTPGLLPGKSLGQRSLVGCIPWGCKESDTTEWLHIHDPFLTSKIFLGKKMYSWVLGCFTIVSNSLGPMDCSPLGFSFHGILQARMLEWIAMPCSRGSSQPRDQTCISCSSCPAGRFFTAEPLKKPRKEDTFSLNGKVAGRVLYHEIFSQI